MARPQKRPDNDVDRQVFDDVLLILLNRGIIPEVITPKDRLASLDAIEDPARMDQLARLAATCPDLEAFIAELNRQPTP